MQRKAVDKEREPSVKAFYEDFDKSQESYCQSYEVTESVNSVDEIIEPKKLYKPFNFMFKFEQDIPRIPKNLIKKASKKLQKQFGSFKISKILDKLSGVPSKKVALKQAN